MFKTFQGASVALIVTAGALSLQGCASMDAPGAIAASAVRTPHAGAQGATLVTAAAPNGYVEFCRREPSECGAPAPQEPPAPSAVEPTSEPQGWLVLASYSVPAIPGFAAPPVDQASVAATPVVEPAHAYPANLVMPSAPGAFDWSSAFAYLDAGGAASLAAEKQAPTVTDPALLERVNRRVNDGIRPERDEAAYGREDYWTLPLETGTRVGDCKDYVLEKRHALIEAGVAPEALSIAVVRTQRGEPHAVLLATTPKGVVVLDSASPWISPWDHSSYALIERQVFGDPLSWVAPAFG